MTEGIIIDGIKYFKQRDINKGLNEEHYVTEFHLLAKHYNLLLEDYARKYNSLKEQLKRKEQECEHWKNHCLCLDGEDVTVQISQEQFEKYQKYKQAELKLEEIKEIVVPIKENTCFGTHCGAIDWILQIIEGKDNV